MIEAEEMAKALLETFKMVLEKTKEAHATLFIEAQTGEIHIVDISQFSNSIREALSLLGGSLGFSINAQRIYLVDEAWVTEIDAGSYEDAIELFRQGKTQREEGLVVSVVTGDGPELSITQKFSRDGDSIIFGEQHSETDFEDSLCVVFFRGQFMATKILTEGLKKTYTDGINHILPNGKTAIQDLREKVLEKAQKLFLTQTYSG